MFNIMKIDLINKIVQILFALIVLNFINLSNMSHAIVGSELYNPEIAVVSKNIVETDRINLIKTKFDNILRQITGKNISLPLEIAEQYLIKYEYLENYPNWDKLTLKLYFDKNLIHKKLSENKYAILNEHRPSTIIWVKVDDPLLLEMVNKFLDIVIRTGRDYGLKIIYPDLDLTEIRLMEQYIEKIELINKDDKHLENEQLSQYIKIKEFLTKYSADEIILADCKMKDKKFLINWKSIFNNWELKNQKIEYERQLFDNSRFFNNQRAKIGIRSNSINPVEVEIRPEIKAQDEIQAKPEIKAQDEIQAKPEIKAQNEIQFQPEIQSQFEIQSQPEIIEFNIQANLFIENLFQHFINLQVNNTKKLIKQLISLKISNITNLEDYVKVEKILQELPVIKGVYTTGLENGLVEFKILVAGGEKAIMQALANNKTLLYSKNNFDKKYANYNIHNSENIEDDLKINNNNFTDQLIDIPSLSYFFQCF